MQYDVTSYFYYQEIFSTPDLECDFHWWEKNITCLHQHMDYYELNLITQGYAQYECNGHKTMIGPGALIYCRPGDIHELTPAKNTDPSASLVLINISFTEKVMNDLSRLLSPDMTNYIYANPYVLLSIPSKSYVVLTDILYDRILLAKDTADYASAIKYWAFTALHQLYHYSFTHLQVNSDRMPDWFMELLAQMNNAQNLKLRLTEFPAYLLHSPVTTAKQFRKFFNTTPNEYFLSLKINYACRLLSTTDFSIESIARMIGFDSSSHFHTIFRQRLGVTPSEYRKTHMFSPS